MKLIKYITIGILWTSVVYADPIVTQSTSNSTVSTTGTARLCCNPRSRKSIGLKAMTTKYHGRCYGKNLCEKKYSPESGVTARYAAT